MHGWLKRADAPPSATGASAASPLPTPSIAPTFAAGLKGPAGISPRTNYARVNTGTPPQPDAGSESQKSMPPRGAEMLPKRASANGEDARMGTMSARPMLQDLVKAAMVDGARRANVNDEAHRQFEKTASEEKCAKCGKDKEKCACMGKMGAAGVTGEVVEKLAGALDFIASELMKNADTHLGGPYNLTEHLVTSPPGVSQATASRSLPDHKGQATPKAVVPMHSPMQKDLAAEHGATQMKDNLTDGLTSQRMPSNIVSGSKHASVWDIIQAKFAAQKAATDEHEKKETEGLHEADKGLAKVEKAHFSEPENKGEKKEGTAPASLVDYMNQHVRESVKQAEDAINPARISAGAAVPPQTSEAGQAGGRPVGGAPKGPSGLVSSNDSARNYQRDAAYAPRKAEMGKYLKEPMLSMEHDSVLRDAFKHTGQAGTKFAEALVSPEAQAAAAATTVKEATALPLAPAPVATPVSSLTKAASAKVLLTRMAADIAQAQAAGAQ